MDFCCCSLGRKVKSLAKKFFSLANRFETVDKIVDEKSREGERKEGRENVKIPMIRIIKGEILVGEGRGNGKLPSDIFMKGT